MNRLRARSELVVVAVALALAGCTVPALDRSTKKCQSDVDCARGEACGPSARCVPSANDAGAPFDLCASLAAFTGVQIVDGADDDLAALPIRTFNAADLKAVGSVAGDLLDVDARVGWSSLGLHAFFHVHYETGHVMVPTGSEPLFFGDGMELFFKADANLTGRYTASRDVGARQLIVVPPAGSAPMRSSAFYDEGHTDLGPVDPSWLVARSAADGYVVELQLPWSAIGGSVAPTAGARIGFDFAVDYRARVGATNPQYQLLLALKSVPDLSAGCFGDVAAPSCDDRTWCAPTLR